MQMITIQKNHHQARGVIITAIWCLSLVWKSALFVCVGMWLSGMQAQAVEANVIQPTVKVSMRHHGYQMGDFIDQTIFVSLPKGIAIDTQSLPLAGYVKPWLDIKKVDFKQAEQQAVLQVQWQVFATVEMTQALKTPAIILKTNSKTSQQIQIPAQVFYYSSVLPAAVNDIQKLPHLPPLLFDSQTPAVLAVSFLGLALLLLGLWLWMTDRLPWWPYRNSPMVRLARGFKHKSTIAQADIVSIYQALNACAGQHVYLSTPQVLFERAPYLLPYQQAITQFLKQANHVIYQHQPLEKQVGSSQNTGFGACDWIKQAAVAERLALRAYQKT